MNRPFGASLEPMARSERRTCSPDKCGRALSIAATTSKLPSLISAIDVMSETRKSISTPRILASYWARITAAGLRSDAVT